MRFTRAFTLVELILVILIISILAVSIVPKLFGANSVEHVAVRDQLISVLRLSQLKAMNQLDICNQVVITSSYIVIEDNENATCGTPASIDRRIVLDEVSINIQGGSSPIKFDANGVSDCDCTINIVGSETAQIKIESEGYIHAL